MTKEKYSLVELFRNLPIPIAELSRRSHISQITATRIRDGRPARIHTINRLLTTLSEIYHIDLTTENVEGINILIGRYGEGKSEEDTSAA